MIDLLRIAVNHQRDAVIITEAERVDTAGRRIVFANAAFTTMFGWSNEEVIGRTPDLTIGALSDRGAIHRIVAAIDTKRPVREEILKYRKDGTTLWVEIDIAPIRDAAGQCTNFVSVMRDITEKKLQNDLLGTQAAELKRAAAQRTQFLGNLSHELRTPLNAIVGNASALLEGVWGAPDLRHHKALHRILGNGQTLVALIEELVDVARIESGRIPVTLQPFAVRELVEDLLVRLQPLAGDLSLSAEGPSTLVMRGDRQKVNQILSNLVSNALKFTPHGSVKVVIAEHGGEISFDVVDTGIGISPENHERVFEEFWQAGAAVSRSHGGAGLGLYIARRLARLLGGDLVLASAPGRGSTFTLRLPCAVAVNRDHPPDGAESSTAR